MRFVGRGLGLGWSIRGLRGFVCSRGGGRARSGGRWEREPGRCGGRAAEGGERGPFPRSVQLQQDPSIPVDSEWYYDEPADTSGYRARHPRPHPPRSLPRKIPNPHLDLIPLPVLLPLPSPRPKPIHRPNPTSPSPSRSTLPTSPPSAANSSPSPNSSPIPPTPPSSPHPHPQPQLHPYRHPLPHPLTPPYTTSSRTTSSLPTVPPATAAPPSIPNPKPPPYPPPPSKFFGISSNSVSHKLLPSHSQLAFAEG